MPKRLQTFINLLFGSIAWDSPPWIKYLHNRARTKPKQVTAISLGIILSIIAIWGSYHWYQSLPKPERVVAKITAPQITPNEEVLTPDTLTIDFGIPSGYELTTKPVAQLNQLGKDIEAGISINPKIAGKWRWDSDSRLIFTPETDWPAGQDYTITFARDFFTPGTNLESLDAKFATKPFIASIDEFKFYQDPTNPSIRQVVATIHFNFPVDTKTFENKINLHWQTLENGSNDSTPFKYTLSFDENKRTAYIHSQNLTLPQTERYIQLDLTKGIKALNGPSQTNEVITSKVLVPDASSVFKISSLTTTIIRNSNDNPEQVINIETTIGVKNQDLKNAIHAYILPKDYPANSVEEAKPNYAWKDPGEITPAILALSQPLTVEAIPSDHDYATLHSFKYNTPTPAYIYVMIDKDIRGYGDFTLANKYSDVLPAPAYPQEISFLHKGALLPLGTEEKLSVLVRGVPAVKFEVAKVLPTDVNHLITQTGGDFSNPYFLDQNFNQDNISEVFSSIEQFDASDASKAHYTALDLSKYLTNTASGRQFGLFLLRARGWNPVKKIPLNAKTNRLILITDMGLIVKDNADGTHDVFVQSISQGNPVTNASVSLLGKNGVPIYAYTTDANGHVTFPSLKDFINEREPTVYLVHHNNDTSFIPYYRSDRQLNYSRFDVGGITSVSETKNTLTAFIFSDRGIYRPGDTTHIGMVVKHPYVLPQPQGLPLEVQVVDPHGVTIKDEKLTLNDSGYLSLDFQTSETSPTGQYIINLYITKDNHPSNLIGSTTIQVNEFQPDRMRISAHLSQENPHGWISPNHLMAKIDLTNLYGTPAANHKISGRILLTPQAIAFDEFPGYTFTDPLLNPNSSPKTYTEALAEAKTNEQGHAELKLNLDKFEKATYRLNVFVEGFEADSGRSVATQVKALVSPLEFLVGYKPDGDLSFIQQNSAHKVHLIAVNPQLKPYQPANLTIQLSSLRPITTLVKKEDGTYQYQSIIQTTEINQTPIAIGETGTDYTIPSDQIGDFLVTVKNNDGAELSKFKFSIVGTSQQPLPKNAQLNVKLNKTMFNPGEEIEMQVTAPYTGSGLITIERDKVYAYKWFKADTTSSIQKIKIPAGFQGDGYVNIAFVRDINSSEIFMSPLSYHVTPFSITREPNKITVDVSAPPLTIPGSPLTISYKTNKPSKIIVFAVDEGILQVSNYKTPDPLAYFFQKHALEVGTTQIVDQILPRFISSRELSSVGGDASDEALGKHLNPFKRKTEAPVVFWSGIIDSDSQVRNLTYNVPDYFNGSLKIMAVAVSADAVGAVSANTKVRGYFVINPNVPTFVSPGDEFDVNATIANNIDKSGDNADVTVNLTASPQLEIIGDSKALVKIPEGSERSVHFKVKANAVLGSAELVFTTQFADKFSKMSATMSIRPATVFATSINSGYSKDPSKSLDVIRTFYPNYRQVKAAAASSPLILVSGLRTFLNDYPYGCTEQLVSKAFPWLILENQPWMATDSADMHEKVKKTIQMLSQRQMASGGFNYWPEVGSTQSNDFSSVYAMHFLTEAREKGYTIPNDVFSAGIGYLKDLANQDFTTLEQARQHAYAIYVLTRNEIVTTNYLTNLQLTLDKDKSYKWHGDITNAYIAATYQLLKNTATADSMIKHFTPASSVETNSDFYNPAIANAQYVFLLAKHFPEKLSSLNPNIIQSLVDALNSESMTTILAGYASLALGSYDQYFNAANTTVISIIEKTVDGQQRLLSASNDKFQQAAIGNEAASINFSNPDRTGYFYQLNQSGFNTKLPDKVLNSNLEVIREYKTSADANLSNPKLGEEILVRIRVRSTNNLYLSNIAIVDLLPGSFEIVRESINASTMDYVDTREDRIIFFGSIGPESIEITYKIKPTSMGKFTVPAIYGTAMYNPGIQSTGIASTLTVVEQ